MINLKNLLNFNTIKQPIKRFSDSVGKLGHREITCNGCGKRVNYDFFKTAVYQRDDKLFKELFKGCEENKKSLMAPTKYFDQTNCALMNLVAEEGPVAMEDPVYSDTEVNTQHAKTFPEAMKETPKSGIDFTGDHGTRCIAFLEKSVQDGVIKEPIGLIDVGGLNNHTVKRFDPKGEKLHTIVDINMVTPMVNEKQDNIRYQITDAEDFANKSAKSEIQRIRNGTDKPVCILMNNFVNAVPPEKAMATIKNFTMLWKKETN